MIDLVMNPFTSLPTRWGGLVARTFIQRYRDRWDKMKDEEKNPGLKVGGRLVMLGTPNHGSFTVPQVITGLESIVKRLSLLNFRHKASELLHVFNSFVGSYQMMPSHIVMPKINFLYDASTYRPLSIIVSQVHLNNDREHHERLQGVVDPGRMIYIAGYDHPTFSGIKDKSRLNALEGYEMTFDGDGRVPHRLGFLDKDGKLMFPTYSSKKITATSRQTSES
jgi:hypothetical protein